MQRKNYLFCKGNRKKGLWLLAKTSDTYAKYMKEDYEGEEKYLSSLSDYEKEWLNTFLQGYYHQSKPAMDKLNFPLILRRERYNQHRGVKNDAYNKRNRSDVWETSYNENSVHGKTTYGLENLIITENGIVEEQVFTKRKRKIYND